MSQVRILSPRPLILLKFLTVSPLHFRIWSQPFAFWSQIWSHIRPGKNDAIGEQRFLAQDGRTWHRHPFLTSCTSRGSSCDAVVTPTDLGAKASVDIAGGMNAIL